MAIIAKTETGKNLYVILLDNDCEVYNGIDFEPLLDANFEDYEIAMTESGTTGIYYAAMPLVPANVYQFLVYQKAGSTPSATDTSIGDGSIRWTGTAEEGVSDNSALVSLIEELTSLVNAIKTKTDLLNVSSVVIATINNPGDLYIRQAVTYSSSIDGLTVPVDWQKVYFTCKSSKLHPDSKSLVQVVVTNGGHVNDGLLYLNGTTPISPITKANASLVVTQSTGIAVISISDDATSLLPLLSGGYYDMKCVTSNGVSTILCEGNIDITAVLTKTV